MASAAATAQAQTVTLQRSATDRAMRAYRAGESGLADSAGGTPRSLRQCWLSMSHIDTLESDSRLRLDLHEMWDLMINAAWIYPRRFLPCNLNQTNSTQRDE
jgi:hypothetical protein